VDPQAPLPPQNPYQPYQQPDEHQELPQPLPLGGPEPVEFRHTHSRAWIAVLVIFVVLLGAAGAGWYLLMRSHDQKSHSTQQPNKPKQQSQAIADPLLAKFARPTTGEKWQAKPKQVADLGYVNATLAPSTTYYQVGSRGGKTIYLADIKQTGAMPLLFEKAGGDAVLAIARPNANETYNTDADKAISNAVVPAITLDTTTHYDSLSLPGKFPVGGGEMATVHYDGYLNLGVFTQGTATTGTIKKVVQTYGSSKLVRIERAYADTKLTAIHYAVDLPTGTEFNLGYTPIASNLSGYTWSNGVQVAVSSDSESNYLMAGLIRGCGAAPTAVTRADAVKSADFVPAGRTPHGKIIYAFKDNQNTLLQAAYNEYASYLGSNPSVTVLSFDDFVSQHGVVAYRNAAGEWLLFTRNNLAPLDACGN